MANYASFASGKLIGMLDSELKAVNDETARTFNDEACKEMVLVLLNRGKITEQMRGQYAAWIPSDEELAEAKAEKKTTKAKAEKAPKEPKPKKEVKPKEPTGNARWGIDPAQNKRDPQAGDIVLCPPAGNAKVREAQNYEVLPYGSDDEPDAKHVEGEGWWLKVLVESETGNWKWKKRDNAMITTYVEDRNPDEVYHIRVEREKAEAKAAEAKAKADKEAKEAEKAAEAAAKADKAEKKGKKAEAEAPAEEA